jgi:imidazole glycerol-phosphate synthase subunit HisH
MQTIAVVDFGTGNLRSVSKAVGHVANDADVVVTRDPVVVNGADRVILPGQGAMGSWLEAMRDRGLADSVRRALTRVPVLGICLGMQALLQSSEEDGGTEGLGLFRGRVRRFERPADARGTFKVPHMGWNRVQQKNRHPLWNGIADQSRFYFVHSFHADPVDVSDVAGTTDYIVDFASAIAKQNVFAVQFHPEKSHTQGLALLNNFVRWDGTHDQ